LNDRCGRPGRHRDEGRKLSIFRKSKTEADVAIERDPSKARSWFDRASDVADSRQYDYAIECYISGLRHDPGNMAMHEALRDVALKRKVGGGKPAGRIERMKASGSDAIDKFLSAEKLWAKDPLSLAPMLQTMKLAVAVDKESPDVGLNEFAHWVGQIILETNAVTKMPDKAGYIELRDLLADIEAYGLAVQACKLAVQADPKDTMLLNELKDLEAENTMKRGGYTGSEGGFKEAVRDMDKQRELDQEDAITKTEAMIEQILERRRAEFEEDPNDIVRLQKLTDALLQKTDQESENEAIELIEKAHEQTGEYRYKVRIGDIRMKQMVRQQKELKAALDADPKDENAKSRLESHYRKRMKFELDQYSERVQNYPTELGLKYQLGIRLFAFKKYDDAIGAFQQAKSDPKLRAGAHDYLGRCYLARGWFDEAVDTFRLGIELYPHNDDRLGKELRYQLMTALENAATKNRSPDQAREAQKIASQLLQTDINYRDIRVRIDSIRDLVESLQPIAGK